MKSDKNNYKIILKTNIRILFEQQKYRNFT